MRIAVPLTNALAIVLVAGCGDRNLHLLSSREQNTCSACASNSETPSSLDLVLRTPPEMTPTDAHAAPLKDSPAVEPPRAAKPTAIAPVIASASGIDGSKPEISVNSTANPPSTAVDLPPTIKPEASVGSLRIAPGDYLIRPGDQLDVLFSEYWKPGVDYRLLPGDEIHVEFLVRPDSADTFASGLNRTLRIQPDGKTAMPFLGVVDAAGSTVGELAQTLSGQYAKLYVEPKVLVTLVSTGSGLANLRESMKSVGGRGAVVAPDGTIGLPHVGIFPAAGMTLKQFEDEVNERYQRAVPGFIATVRLAGRG